MIITNTWYANGMKITDTTNIGENQTSITQVISSIKDNEELEVTHNVFFGENIKRILNTLK